MSGVKHTPGPWSDKGGSAGAVWAGNEFIASVYPNAQPGWDGYGQFDRQDETEANARLIAAAPDLLEAGMELQAARKAQNADPSAKNALRVRAASDAFDTALSKATAQQEGS
ncbi:hypothetical protein [Brevundimonas diminuta]|uniref:Uncharacterized protein n=1 Tax=Brevundimonas diminuta TaxID=293 RepID=A0A410NVE2_BREDI|nr:hypothetical protein [Brevundimonas diminuta]QAT13844.1 hypothetical protein EQG53_05435 [Brevundimonas diminuta]QQB88791.1 hypothetical protein I6H83_16995 [Brevundimonas diminuta]GEC02339.1 hypothetical protein BDI01nite_34030 [Brevundimonas diminuta]